MTLAATALPFGMREISLTPIADDGTLGTALPLPNPRTLSFTEGEDFEELRGGDRVVTAHGSGASCSWDMEAGGLSLEAYKTIAGGSITTSGVSPNTVKTYKKKVTDSRPFFKAQGRAISDSGGDFKVVLYRCRATDDIEGELGDGAFWLTKASGTGFPSQEAGHTDDLYDFISSETATPFTYS